MPILAIFSLLLTGCKFGDGEDGMEELAKKKRVLNYHCSVTLPSFYPCDTALVDMGPDGMNVNWRIFSDIAVMGSEFHIQKDTIESASYPVPFKLSYNRYLSPNCIQEGNLSILSYDFSSNARHGNGDDYSTLINLVYPYERVIMSSGDLLLSNADSIPMDFNDQDGKLSSIEERYFIALGRSRAVCTNSDVLLTDHPVCQLNHDHASYSDSRILLDPKIAILRLSFIVSSQDDFTLRDYLRGKSMSGNYHYIDKIEISNRELDPSRISRAQLNLNTGWMEPQKSAVDYLVLTDKNHFVNHLEITREESQRFLLEGFDAFSWGTTVYVAIPCTEEGRLTMSPMITVYVKHSEDSIVEKYYGTVSPYQLKEGGYYITTPIRLFESVELATHPAQLYETPACF